MRRYDIVTGILLILSIIDFTLAAPVSVRKNRHAHVDVANIPKSARNVLGQRWVEDLEKLGEGYLASSGKPIDSSGAAHSSSSSAPVGLDHGSTNEVQPPPPNQASSTTNPDSSTDLSCSPSGSSQSLRARGGCLGLIKELLTDDGGEYKNFFVDPTSGPMFTTTTFSLGNHGPYREFAEGMSQPTEEWGHVSQPTAEWGHVSQPAAEWGHVPQPTPSNDDGFDWKYWMNAEDRPTPPPPKTPGQVGDDIPSASGYAPGPPPTGPDDFWLSGAPTTADDPGLQLDHQPVDLKDAVYKAKGKAMKESRRISGTARDVGNAG
jgi:hypothetical protein